MSKLASIALFLLVGATASADIGLSAGDVIFLNGQQISCEVTASQPHASAVEKTCGETDVYGKCKFYNQKPKTGRYCATGSKCGRINPWDAKECLYFDYPALCADTPCYAVKKCASWNYWDSSKCDFYEETVSCDP